MPYAYCTKEQVKILAAPEADLTDDDQADRIDLLCQNVAAMIDTYTKRPAGYFTAIGAGPDPAASVRRYRGEGKNFLRIGRHVGAAEITTPAVAPSSIYEDPQGWIRYNDGATNNGSDDYFATTGGQFFSNGAVYFVSARWGFLETPGDIIQAAALIVGEIWDRGNGVIGQVSPTGFVIEREMPLQARAILDGWKRGEFEIL